MTAKEHNRMVGIFLMAHGAFYLLIMVVLAIVYGVIGGAMVAGARRDEEAMMGGIFVAMVFLMVFFGLLLSTPQIIGGWKLFKERPNARIWGIVGSIVAMLNMPLGTAAGIYGVWFLFGEEGKRFYLNGGQERQMFNPPPPSDWR